MLIYVAFFLSMIQNIKTLLLNFHHGFLKFEKITLLMIITNSSVKH